MSSSEMAVKANRLFGMSRDIRESSAQVAPGVTVASMPNREVSPEEANAMVTIVGSACGPEIPTYVNVPWKSIHEALRRHVPGEVPPYLYSCPQVDEMCLGLYPNTVYLDIGRGGPLNTVKRSADYLTLAQQKMQSNTDPRVQAWIENYGIGTAIPLAARRDVFQWAVESDAKIYLIPATSVAEGTITAYKRLYPGMDLDTADPWFQRTADEESLRDHASMRFFELFVNQQTRLEMARLMRLPISFAEFAKRMMAIVDEKFLIYDPKTDKSRFGPESAFRLASHRWGHMLYNPEHSGSHPVNGNTADCSEIVVRGQDLPPTPYRHMLLLGDKLGTSLSQLVAQAKLIHDAMPGTQVTVLTDREEKPLTFSSAKTPSAEDAFVVAWIDRLMRKEIVRDFKADVLCSNEEIVRNNPQFQTL